MLAVRLAARIYPENIIEDLNFSKCLINTKFCRLLLMIKIMLESHRNLLNISNRRNKQIELFCLSRVMFPQRVS